jgi:hypothetical protein
MPAYPYAGSNIAANTAKQGTTTWSRIVEFLMLIAGSESRKADWDAQYSIWHSSRKT